MSFQSLFKTKFGVETAKKWMTKHCEFHRFAQEFKLFKKLSLEAESPQRFRLTWEDRWPCLEDRTTTTSFDRHYVYHTAWATRILSRLKPSEHIDISSSLFFSGMLSAFIPVRFFDYRPADLRLDNLSSEAADLLNLPFPDSSIQSLSCMHVVEHIGLGRYGDPLNPNGDVKAMQELHRVLAPGGSLLFVVPVGVSRVCFNAHRVYNYGQICREVFSDLELKQCSLIPDDPNLGGLIENPSEEMVDSQQLGCGCFWFRKRDELN